MTPAIEKYLARYAEPEAQLAERLGGSYASALVVPVLAESQRVLAGFEAAFRGAQGRGLLILVVNASADASREHRAANELLLTELANRPGRRVLASSPPATLLAEATHDLLVVDRSSDGFCLASKEGVGRARRIGCDIALALAFRGALTARGVGCTDADATLPAEYFSAAEQALPGRAAALFPFRHQPSGDVRLDDATEAYELSIRYYVLGLAHAGSPYAFHTVGSTLYLDLVRYASVRGFGNRQAGEDFYLLNKVVKVAPIRRLHEPTIDIQSRRSTRVPFGTGPGVTRLLERRAQGEDLLLYAPSGFEALRAWLSTLDEFAKDPGLRIDQGPLLTLQPADRSIALDYLETINAPAQLALAAEKTRSPEQLRLRLHTWFDGFKSLKFIHAWRAAGHADLPSEEALAKAPFVSGAATSIGDALECARQAERQLPRDVGLTPF